MASAEVKQKDKKKKKKENGRAGGGLDDALGVAVAGVALAAGAGVAAGRAVRARFDADGSIGGSGHNGNGRTDVTEKPSQKPPAKGIKGKLEALGKRFKLLGHILDVQSRYGDLHGNNLAAAVTFQAFISLFPLLLIAVAIVGFVAGGGTDIAGRIISELGLTGEAATAVTDAVDAASKSKKAASVVGLVSLLWSGLGLVNALQYGYNQVWQVEERGLKDKAVGIFWLAGAVVVFLAAAAITTALNWLPGIFAPLGIALALAVNVGLWMWTSKVLPNTKLPWKAVIPGSIFAAIGLEVLKALGAFYVPRAVASSSQLYGTLGIVFAILAWLFFFGRLIIYSATLNVVLWEKKAGTVKVVTEVPRQPGASLGEQVSRMGRLEAGATA